jgi:hypothetical protein
VRVRFLSLDPRQGLCRSWRLSDEELFAELAASETQARAEHAHCLALIAELATRDAAAKQGYPHMAVLLPDPQPSDAEPLYPRRELHLHRSHDGRLTSRFTLDPEAAALLESLLSPLANPGPGTPPDPTRTTRNARPMRW